MLAIVPRSGTDSVATPGPVNSNTFSLPPLTDRRRSSSRITSLACTQGRCSSPSSHTSTTDGQVSSNG